MAEQDVVETVGIGGRFRRFKSSLFSSAGLYPPVVDPSVNQKAVESASERFHEIDAEVLKFKSDCEAYSEVALSFMTQGNSMFVESYKPLKEGLTDLPLYHSVDRAIKEYITYPLSALTMYPERIRKALKQHKQLLFDYMHYIKKFEGQIGKHQSAVRRKEEQDRKDQMAGLTPIHGEVQFTEYYLRQRAKLETCQNRVKESSKNVLAMVEALQFALHEQKLSMCAIMSSISKAISEFISDGLNGSGILTDSFSISIKEQINNVKKGIDETFNNSTSSDISDIVEMLPAVVPAEELFAYKAAFDGCLAMNGTAFGTYIPPDAENHPAVFTKLISYLDAKGLYTNSIFITPGQKSIVNHIKNRLSTVESLDLSDELAGDENGPLDVAEILLIYLKENPEPLVPRICYTQILSACSHPSDLFTGLTKEVFVKNWCTSLDMLRILLGLLSRIAQCAPYNQMTSDRMASIFAPLIFQPLDQQEAGIPMTDLRKVVEATLRLINLGEEVLKITIWLVVCCLLVFEVFNYLHATLLCFFLLWCTSLLE
jgi:hypothetical protein